MSVALRGLKRIRTAVRGFADLCLATRPSDHIVGLLPNRGANIAIISYSPKFCPNLFFSLPRNADILFSRRTCFSSVWLLLAIGLMAGQRAGMSPLHVPRRGRLAFSPIYCTFVQTIVSYELYGNYRWPCHVLGDWHLSPYRHQGGVLSRHKVLVDVSCGGYSVLCPICRGR